MFFIIFITDKIKFDAVISTGNSFGERKNIMYYANKHMSYRLFFFGSYSSCFLLTIIKKAFKRLTPCWNLIYFSFIILIAMFSKKKLHIYQCIIILYWINSNYFNKKHNDCRNQCVYNDFHLILPSWKFRCKNWHIELLIKRLDYELNVLLYLPRLSTITSHCTGIKKKKTLKCDYSLEGNIKVPNRYLTK